MNHPLREHAAGGATGGLEVYAFDEFELDAGRALLSHRGRELPLRPKSFDVLGYLVRHPNRVLTRQELLDAVWPGLVVTEDSLTQCMIDIRRALGERGKGLVRTVRGRGYLLDAAVEVRIPRSALGGEPGAGSGYHMPLLVGVSLAVVALLLVAYMSWDRDQFGEARSMEGVSGAPPPSGTIASAPGRRADDRVNGSGLDERRASQAQGQLAADMTGNPASPSRAPGDAAFEQVQLAAHYYQRRQPGDIERAERGYRQAIALDPGYADAWLGLANTLNLQRRMEPGAWNELTAEHDRALDTVLRLNPDDPVAILRSAFRHMRSGDWNAVESGVQSALELGADDPSVLSRAAVWRQLQGRPEEAISLYEAAVSLDPLSRVYRGNLADYLLRAGSAKEALWHIDVLVDSGLTMKPDVAELRSRALVLRRRADEALAQLLDSEDGVERDAGLALVYSALGMESEAGAAMGQLRQRDQHSRLIRLAEIHAFRGEADLAFDQLRAIAGAAPPGPLGATGRMSALSKCLSSPFTAALQSDPRWASWRDFALESLPPRT